MLFVCANSCKSCQSFGDGGISLDQQKKTTHCVFSVLCLLRCRRLHGKALLWIQILPDFFTLAAAAAAANKDADDEDAGQHRHGDD